MGPLSSWFIGCGAWIRTKDLRVMSPTSCRCSTPRRHYTSPSRKLTPAEGLLEAAAALRFEVPFHVEETLLA
jgi:hypothetical protein